MYAVRRQEVTAPPSASVEHRARTFRPRGAQLLGAAPACRPAGPALPVQAVSGHDFERVTATELARAIALGPMIDRGLRSHGMPDLRRRSGSASFRLPGDQIPVDGRCSSRRRPSSSRPFQSSLGCGWTISSAVLVIDPGERPCDR